MKTAIIFLTVVLGTSFSGISLSLENTFPAQGKAMGLDVVENPSGSEVSLLGTNNTDDAIYFYTPSGMVTDTIQLDPLNGSCFGAVYNLGESTLYTNDWEHTDLFCTDDMGSTWNTVQDPAENSGRGLAFLGDHYWTTNGYSGLLQFTPGYPPTQTFILPEIYGQLSGLTVFPFEGSTAVAVTTYSDLNIWFYTWDGAVLQFLGSAPCPAPCQASYGLAFSNNRGTIFWSYKTASGEYLISEFSFEIDQSLQQHTWGGIKSSF